MALNNYIEDDWDDNALTSRSNPEKGLFYQYGDGGTGDLLKGVYRPRWEVTTGTVNATNSELLLQGGTSAQCRTQSILTVGSWQVDIEYQSGASAGTYICFLFEENFGTGTRPNQGYYFKVSNSSQFDIRKNDNGTYSTVVSDSSDFNFTNLATCLVERDSYGNFEGFKDGSSIGTGNDTQFSRADGRLAMYNGTGSDITIDNFAVQ